jgi:hypothetical protein
LFTVRRNGTNPRRLLSYGFEVSPKLDWAPDGRHILITEYADHPDGHTPNVAIVRPDGSGLHRLTHLDGAEVELSLDPSRRMGGGSSTGEKMTSTAS